MTTGIHVVYSDGVLDAICEVPGHLYEITLVADHNLVHSTLNFQNGPIGEVGVNGIQNEPVIAILIDRLKFLDAAFPSDFNKNAIMHLEEALKSLQARTANRISRGVEGTNVV